MAKRKKVVKKRAPAKRKGAAKKKLQLVTQAEFARLEGKSRSTISRMVKAGRIDLNKDGLIDVAAARKKIDVTESPAPHHQARKEKWEDDKEQQQNQGSRDRDAVNLRLKIATTEEREAKAAVAEMERKKMVGSLIERDIVEGVIADFGVTLRKAAESLPDRYSAELSGLGGDTAQIHAALEAAVNEMLLEISDYIKRQARDKFGGE